jgi:hypothetical protein
VPERKVFGTNPYLTVIILIDLPYSGEPGDIDAGSEASDEG